MSERGVIFNVRGVSRGVSFSKISGGVSGRKVRGYCLQVAVFDVLEGGKYPFFCGYTLFIYRVHAPVYRGFGGFCGGKGLKNACVRRVNGLRVDPDGLPQDTVLI